MKIHSSIKEKHFNDIINEEYQMCKIALSPLLKGVNRSFVKFYWGDRMKRFGGYCYYRTKQIILSSKYRDIGKDDWSIENFKMTLRHEIVHLIAKGHDGRFLSLLKQVEGHRYVGEGVYKGKQK